MNITPPAEARDIIGSWRTPEMDGVELGYYFYPDGILLLRNPRNKKFTARGAWTLEEGGSLVISDVEDLLPGHSEAEREVIRAERHRIAITKLSGDSMEWLPEEAAEKVEFHRAGGLPERERKSYWRRLFSLE